MSIQIDSLPETPALLRVESSEGSLKLALWRDGTLWDLSSSSDAGYRSLASVLSQPLEEVRGVLDGSDVKSLPALDPERWTTLAPVDSQEVWAAGVTYRRSREARMEEAQAKDMYARVYEAERPELFFKAAGWRVVPDGGTVGVRSDSGWDVPEPELAVLSNRAGEVVAYACGNDMSSRSIEGLNPLYLPQAKVYDASCSIGPVAVLAWNVDLRRCEIRMVITRGGDEIFSGRGHVSDMVRNPSELVGVLHAVYALPAGAWLLTGTSIVPPPPYTALPGDEVAITIEGVGTLRNTVRRIEHSGAQALPRLPSEGG